MGGNRLDVEFLAPVRPVAVAENAQVLQDVQRPVDGRRDGPGVHFPAALDELGSGDVTVRPRQDLDEGPTLGRPA